MPLAHMTNVSFSAVFVAAFTTVLLAELVGDKAIYTISSLVLRFRLGIVVGACVAAFAGKMLVVVFLGSLVARAPAQWTSLLSATAFFASALFIWHNENESLPPNETYERKWWRAALISFGALFFTEWGDPGQIAAAALSAQTHATVPIWLGGTLAMVTKGALAATLGTKLRDALPHYLLRPLASASCLALGMLALGRMFFL